MTRARASWCRASATWKPKDSGLDPHVRDNAVSILAEFDNDTLHLLAQASNQPVATIREGLRACKSLVSKKTANKITKVNLAFKVVRHLTQEYCRDLLEEFEVRLRSQARSSGRSFD